MHDREAALRFIAFRRLGAIREYDRFGSLEQLLDELAELRQANIGTLRNMNLTSDDFSRKGLHPALGDVNLGQLLAAWVVHDLNHIHQIAQTMARQYTEAVGAWREYLLVL